MRVVFLAFLFGYSFLGNAVICENIFFKLNIKPKITTIKSNWNTYTDSIKKYHLGFNYSVPKSMPTLDYIAFLNTFIKENESQEIYDNYLELLYFPFSSIIKDNLDMFSLKEQKFLDLKLHKGKK